MLDVEIFEQLVIVIFPLSSCSYLYHSIPQYKKIQISELAQREGFGVGKGFGASALSSSQLRREIKDHGLSK